MTPRRWLVWLPGACALLLLAATAHAAPPGRAIPGELIVKYRPGVTETQKATARGALPGVRRLHDFAFIRAEHVSFGGGLTTEQAMARLRSNPRVEYVEPNFEVQASVTPNDTRFSELWAMKNTGQTGGTPGVDIGATQAWDIYTGDPNLMVGVIDTGVDYTHPDLVPNIWTNPGEIPGNGIDDDGNGYIDDVHGYDFANNDGDPMDDHGHGTHVAGTIAGRGNNSLGVTGVAWQAQIVCIKFLAANGFGSTATAIQSIDYARRVGVRLTNNSWGGGEYSQALLDAINTAGAAGELAIASAGNTGSDNDVAPNYPASYDSPYIISVASTNHFDQLGDLTNFGLTTVDLGAPGSRILSCAIGGGYVLMSGTSMAAPHVSGACALLWGKFPNATNLEIKQAILAKVDLIPALAGKCVTGGRLDLRRALAEADTVLPGNISNVATETPGSTTMGLTWTATGDDGGVGTVSRYDVRFSTAPITHGNFANATRVPTPTPHVAGATEHYEVSGLSYTTTYYFALKPIDEYGNSGPLSNVASGTTFGPPAISVDPGSMTKTLPTGGSSFQFVSVSNTGAGRLDFTASTQLIPPISNLVLAPGVDQVASAPGAVAAAVEPLPGVLGGGGPDAFGYRWTDSDGVGGPVFDWIDISGIGTPLDLEGEDSNLGPIELGFGFPFYGTMFSTVRVQTNGALSFDDLSFPYANVPLPSTAGMTNMIAPWWDDQNFGATRRAYAYTDGSRFIVEWLAVPHHSAGSGPYTYEVILYPNGEIRFQYLSMAANSSGGTIGVQNGTKTVGLNVTYNSSYMHDNLAIRIIPLRQWLAIAPATGQVQAGDAASANLIFDATGLIGGVYQANVQFANNSPVTPKTLPVTLTVVGTPNLAAAPDTTYFGSRFAGGTYSGQLTVTNTGSDTLRVANVLSSDPSLVASPATFNLAPSAPATVHLSWHPLSAGLLNATLQIASNDPDTPTTTRHAIGSAVAAPAFGIAPQSLDLTLNMNADTTNTVRVTNTGTSTLTFSAQAIVALGDEPNVRGVAGGSARRGGVAAPTRAGRAPASAQVLAPGPAPNALGGPDAFGYQWIDSHQLGGPAFDWIEISDIGTVIPLGGDDLTTASLPVGFDFPFYGTPFSTFHLCSNGWISFTSSAIASVNTTLPNTGAAVPENLIAAFWDDLVFTNDAQVFYHYDGMRLVIEYKRVPKVGDTTSPNTFEIVLYPDGRIVIQYLALESSTLNSATIGIQNATRNDGLQVAFNASYLTTSLAVVLTPPPGFLTVTPPSGSIPPGGFVDLTVGFDATGMTGGDYGGTVRFDTNDPLLAEYGLRAILHVVDVPDLAASPVPVALDTAFIGFPKVRPLAIHNRGSLDLVVDQITVSNPSYVTSGGLGTIPAGDSSVVTVTFTPTSVGSYPATLTIHSNDPDTPVYQVPVTGVGRFPPDIATSAASITHELPAGSTFDESLVLGNSGPTNLYWALGVNDTIDTAVHWLTATPLLGTVVPSSLNAVGLHYDTGSLSPGTYHANLHITSNDPDENPIDIPVTLTVTAIVGVDDARPARYGVRLAGANPVRREATIELALPAAGHAEVGVYDLRGALVTTLANGELPAGFHALRWDGRDGSGRAPAAGVYFVRAKTQGGEFRRRFVYLK